ncbi:MAG: hypothetical protein WBD40_18020 [Tepidisphaeraceae bacterium]
MRGSQMMWSALLGCAIVVGGCEKKDEATPSAAPSAVPEATEEAVDATKSAAEGAADSVKSAAGDAADATKKTAEAAGDAVKKGADAAADAVAASPAAAEATKQIEQVTTYIKENKLDLAETTLKKLEDNKASLPAAIQTKLPSVRTMLDTAKKAAGAVPAAPAAK